MKAIGFEPIGRSFAWRSCFWHPAWQMLLTIYVDDFKMAGPTERMAEAWKAIGNLITLSEPEPVDMYLGCKH